MNYILIYLLSLLAAQGVDASKVEENNYYHQGENQNIVTVIDDVEDY